jgi:quercetin dioxygenase-like cupin family protein
MPKIVQEFVTFWGPSINEWGDGSDTRFVVDRDEALYRNGARGVARKMEKVSVDEIVQGGDVVTGVDMVNGFMPLVLYANDDVIIEVATCDREQGGWHRNLGGDEFCFQYKGGRTLETEAGDITINEGEMTVIPKGVAHKNIGLGKNIEITIYTKKSLKRLAPTDPEAARTRMKIKDGKPVMPPVTLDTDVDG